VSETPRDEPDEDLVPLSPRAIRWFAGSFYVLLAVAGLAWVRLRTGSWLPATATGGDAGRSLLFGAILAIVVIGATGSLLRLLPWMRWLAGEMRRVLGPVDARTAGWVALVSGVGEEVLFRGALLPVTGLLLSSLIFAVVHTGPDRRYLAWTGFSFVVGLALGAIVVQTGSMAGAVLAHVAINAVNLLRIGRMVDNPETRANVPE
jgi:membrane protease YdiL (CAAX protease family)